MTTTIACLFTLCAYYPSECHDVFFFQAEDGIRDRNVTGVQTCALPICVRRRSTAAKDLTDALDLDIGARLRTRGLRVRYQRSEERRVGKECRSRLSPFL